LADFSLIPVFGAHGGDAPFLEPSKEERNYLFIRRTIIQEFERHKKEGCGNR
jgi:hypothetical protein